MGRRRKGSDTIPCPYCKREIYDGAERCPYCEQYVSQEDAPASDKAWWLIVGVAVCLFLVCWWIIGR